MKTKAITNYNKTDLSTEYYSLATALTVFAVLGIAYMYLLSASIVHVVMSKETEEKIHRVNSEIAALEAEYMEKQHTISQEIVDQNGYVKVANKIFIDINGGTLVTQR